jgi:hypothetical protein
MKRRIRTRPTNPYYSTEPAVSTKQIADQPLFPNAKLANKTPKRVPQHPGKMSGIAGFAQAKRPKSVKFKAPSQKVPPVKSAVSIPKQGQGRKLSSTTKGHRIGLRKL